MQAIVKELHSAVIKVLKMVPYIPVTWMYQDKTTERYYL